MKKIAVLTSGGDAPGMNAAVRATTLIGAQAGVDVFGVARGYEGLLAREWRPLTRHVRDRLAPERLVPEQHVENAAHLGGSILGSARCKAFYEAAGRARAAVALKEFDGLVVIGGNGSLTGARALAVEHGARVVGIPASIDNDIGCTSSAIGVDTALNTIIEACDRISDTARAHRRAFIVEVMGRQSGYLCMASAIAAGADAALFREDGRTPDDIVRAVAEVVRRGFESDRGKDRVLVIKAEGVEIPCTRLAREVEAALRPTLGDVEIRATVLGHVVRGGSPSFLDRMIASRFALGAMTALLEGKTNVMTAWQTASTGGAPTQDRSVTLFGLDRVLEETAALLDGTSAVTKHRVGLMQKAAGVLSL